MTVTSTDIANRALTMLGLQKRISSLSQDSAEAQAISSVYSPILAWCFGIANWNFARSTAVLTISKGPPTVSPGVWSSAQPAPPWLYEYTVPADFVRALYITNSDAAAPTAGWLGEPKRFVVGNDTIAAVPQPVLLTNEPSAVLIYTANVSAPTNWPWYFERLAVIAVAHGVCLALTHELQLFEALNEMLEQQISIASQINQLEGLVIVDSTPEWNQALGINYPYRRIDPLKGQNLPQAATGRTRGTAQ